jgi:lysophospholipase L1-like esterase
MQQAPAPHPTDVNCQRKILLLGDSLTQLSFSHQYGGWGAGLSDWYQRRADVVNRGFGGWNTRWIRYALPEILPPDEQDYVLATLFLGANDSAKDGCDQHVPLGEYSTNLAAIIDRLKQMNNHIKIILITPPPNNPELWPNRLAVEQYAEAMLAVGEQYQLPVVNLWKPDTRIESVELFDGLHFANGANEKLLNELMKVIRENYSELAPDDLDSTGQPKLSEHLPDYPEMGSASSKEEAENIIKSWKWT